MKKILLFTIAYISFINSYAQTYCIPKYSTGCSAMGIASISIDSSNNSNKFNSNSFNTSCGQGGYSDLTTKGISTTLYTGNSYNIIFNGSGSQWQNVSLYLDLNQDGDFFDIGENFNKPFVFGTNSSTFSIPIPSTSSLGKTRLRIATSNYYSSSDLLNLCTTTLIEGETEDYLVNITTKPMSFVSSTTNAIPYPTTVVPNDTSKYVLQVQINMDGSLKPQTLKNLKFTTTGTSNVSAIKNAKLWYSGTSFTLSFGKQLIGTPISVTKDTFNFVLTQPLLEGRNHFWLTYDIAAGALPNDTLKASCEEINIDGLTYIPTLKNGLSGGLIVDYCKPYFKSSCENQASLNISSIKLASISESNFECNYNKNYYSPNSSQTFYLEQGSKAAYIIENGTQKLYYGIYIDYNNDGKYDGLGEFTSLGLVESNSTIKGIFAIPNDANTGYKRLRINCSDTNIDKSLFCLTANIGESHDYNINIYEPEEMVLIESYYYKEGDIKLNIPSQNNEIVKIKFKAEGSNNPIILNKFTFNTGNSNFKIIEKAKLWYSAIENDITNAVQIGKEIAFPQGEFSFEVSQELLPYTNMYFWVTYDISSTANAGENLEAETISISDSKGNVIKPIADVSYNSNFPQNISGTRITYKSVLMSNTTIKGCNNKFYDDGGLLKNYSKNGYTTIFTAPDTMSRVSITFNTLNLGKSITGAPDYIELYDGKTLLNTISYIESGSTVSYTTKATNSLTVVLKTGGLGGEGWDADINCVYRCDIDPLSFKSNVTAKCAGEDQLLNLVAKTGHHAPYTYQISNINTKTIYLKTNKSTLDTNLSVSEYYSNEYTIKITNSKGCEYNENLSLVNPLSNFYVYDYNNTKPTCNKAKDGRIVINPYPKPNTNNTIAIDSITWKSSTRKGRTNTIENVGYNELYTYTVYSDGGKSCQVATTKFSSNQESPTNVDLTNDTSESLVLDKKPYIVDSLFTVGEKTNSNIKITPLHYYSYYGSVERLISPYVTTVMPDSIRWIINPIAATIITPGDTIATSIWNKNFSGKVKITAEPFKGVCRGYISPETEVIIKPLANITTKETELYFFKGDSTKVSIELTGTKPFTISYSKSGVKNKINISNIRTNKYDLYFTSAGTYTLENLYDSSMTAQSIGKNYSVSLDVLRNATPVITAPKCVNQKSKVGFVITGGKAPYQIHIIENKSTSKTYNIIKKISINDSTGIDTLLSVGDYTYRVVDAAKDTSIAFYFSIQETLKEVTIPAIVSKISSVPVNTPKISVAISSSVIKMTYQWLSSDTNLIKTTNTSSSATFNITPHLSGKADLSVIAIDASGCKSDTSSILTVAVIPSITLTSGTKTIYYNETDTLRLKFLGSLPAKISISGLNPILTVTANDSIVKVPINKSGTYSISTALDVYSQNAPIITNTYILNIDTINSIVASSTPALCAGKKGTISITAKGGKSPYSYLYQGNGVTFTSLNKDTNLFVGNYNLLVTDAAGFISKPQLITINSLSKSLAGTTITSPLSTKSITIDSLTTSVSCKDISLKTYRWIVSPSSAGIASDSSTKSAIKWTQNYSGKINLSVIGLTTEGCITDSSAKVKINRTGKIIKIESDKDKIVNGDSAEITITVLGSAPFNLTYTINKKNHTISNILTSQYKFRIGEIGLIENLIVKDKDTLTLTNSTTNTISIARDSISSFKSQITKKADCKIGQGEIKFTIIGGKSPYDISATNKNKAAIFSFMKVKSDSIIKLDIGQYKFSVTDASGLVSQLTVEDSITLNANSIENTKPAITCLDTIINGQSAFTKLTGSIQGFSNTNYHWISKKGNTIDSPYASVTNIYWNKKFSGFDTISLVANSGMCYSDTAVKFIKVKANIVLTKRDTAISITTYGRGPFDISIKSSFSTTNIITPGDTLIPLINTEFIKMIDLFTNEITLIGKTIKVDSILPKLKIYTAFSPNGDDKNQCFVIDNINPISSKLHIYDELGFEIFTSKGAHYSNDWKGNDNNGNELSSGVYICTFENGDKTYSEIIELRK